MDTEKLQRWAGPRLILVATNLADEATLVGHAASQARENGAKVLLVHVLRPPSLHAQFSPRPESLIRSSRSAAAWEVLLRMAKMIEWQGAECEPVLLEGEPAKKISELVRERAVDRVIVATRSTQGLERLLAGSVAESLMDSVEVPVCIVGPGAAANPFRGMTTGHIILALSLHRNRPDCVEFAASLASRTRTALTMMHAVDAAGLGEPDKTAAHGVAHAALVALASKVQGPLPPFDIAIHEGSAVRAILKEEASRESDFIIMGSSSHGMVSALFGTSVVHRVVAAARCPVITLRPASIRTPSAEAQADGRQFSEHEELVAGGSRT